jgi:hypothetical protein
MNNKIMHMIIKTGGFSKSSPPLIKLPGGGS